jgi:hypothetical protein
MWHFVEWVCWLASCLQSTSASQKLSCRRAASLREAGFPSVSFHTLPTRHIDSTGMVFYFVYLNSKKSDSGIAFRRRKAAFDHNKRQGGLLRQDSGETRSESFRRMRRGTWRLQRWRLRYESEKE